MSTVNDTQMAYSAAILGALAVAGQEKARGAKLFDAHGTHLWNVPDGVSEITVTASGAGGGGSGVLHSTGEYAGWGGGAGALLVRKRFTVTPGTELAVVIGKGGEGKDPEGGDAEAGGSTSVRGLFSLKGGLGAPVPYKEPDGGLGGAKTSDWDEERAGENGAHGARILSDTLGDIIVGGLGGPGILSPVGAFFDISSARFGAGGRGGDICTSERGGRGGDGFVLIEWERGDNDA